uniref:Thiolase (Fragments) n=1 Tax=Sarcophaga peregrina TaxID=7386 RepID=Q9TXG1_SARPE
LPMALGAENLAEQYLNVNGGAIALGHPLGAQGQTIMGHL